MCRTKPFRNSFWLTYSRLKTKITSTSVSGQCTLSMYDPNMTVSTWERAFSSSKTAPFATAKLKAQSFATFSRRLIAVFRIRSSSGVSNRRYFSLKRNWRYFDSLTDSLKIAGCDLAWLLLRLCFPLCWREFSCLSYPLPAACCCFTD